MSEKISPLKVCSNERLELPWTYRKETNYADDHESHRYYGIYGKPNDHGTDWAIALLEGDIYTDDEQEANAKLIVTAVNSHAALVSALEKAAQELNVIRARDGVPYTYSGWKSDVSHDYFSSVVDECFAALKLAKGET